MPRPAAGGWGETGTDRHWDGTREALFLSGPGRQRAVAGVWGQSAPCGSGPGHARAGGRGLRIVTLCPRASPRAGGPGRPLCGLGTTQAPLWSGREKTPRPPWHSNPCPDPRGRPVSTIGRAWEGTVWPGASSVAIGLRESKAVALNFSPKLLCPESGKQEVVATGKEESALGAGQRLQAPRPCPSHASPGTVNHPPTQLLQAPCAPLLHLPALCADPCLRRPAPVCRVRTPTPLGTPRSAGPAVSWKPPRGCPCARSALGEARCHRRPRALSRGRVESSAAHTVPRGDEPGEPDRCPRRARGCGHQVAGIAGTVGQPGVPEPGPNVRARPAARNHGSRRLGAQPPSAPQQPPRCQGGGGGPGRELAPARPPRPRGPRGAKRKAAGSPRRGAPARGGRREGPRGGGALEGSARGGVPAGTRTRGCGARRGARAANPLLAPSAPPARAVPGWGAVEGGTQEGRRPVFTRSGHDGGRGGPRWCQLRDKRHKIGGNGGSAAGALGRGRRRRGGRILGADPGKFGKSPQRLRSGGGRAARVALRAALALSAPLLNNSWRGRRPLACTGRAARLCQAAAAFGARAAPDERPRGGRAHAVPAPARPAAPIVPRPAPPGCPQARLQPTARPTARPCKSWLATPAPECT
nr:collagen alpha-1(III) chain-like [Pan troglodytes]